MAIRETGRGWHSGISSWVRLAAMMPATRATPITSPFAALPLSTRSSVFAAMVTRPWAMATRSVTALGDTSTMRASPRALRCVSLAGSATGLLRGAQTAGSAAHAAAKERARRGFDVALPHQAFPDQERRDPGLGKLVEIGRRKNPALADRDAVARNLRREPLAGGERRLESLEIAVVDADQPGTTLECALELALVVHFEQGIHAEGLRGLFEVPRQRVVDRRHDDEDAVGAPR